VLGSWFVVEQAYICNTAHIIFVGGGLCAGNVGCEDSWWCYIRLTAYWRAELVPAECSNAAMQRSSSIALASALPVFSTCDAMASTA
jgi:hypothetical protein